MAPLIAAHTYTCYSLENTPININFVHRENYNFLDCDWFKKTRIFH